MPVPEERVTEVVRQQQPAAAPIASNRGRLHGNAAAPDGSAVSLLHLAEQAPAEAVGALSQLVQPGRDRRPELVPAFLEEQQRGR